MSGKKIRGHDNFTAQDIFTKQWSQKNLQDKKLYRMSQETQKSIQNWKMYNNTGHVMFNYFKKKV